MYRITLPLQGSPSTTIAPGLEVARDLHRANTDRGMVFPNRGDVTFDCPTPRSWREARQNV